MKDLSKWKGEFVRLNAAGMRTRQEELHRVEGFVDGVVTFPLKKKDIFGAIIREDVTRLRVDWGKGRIYTENPEFLVLK